MYVKDSLTIIR